MNKRRLRIRWWWQNLAVLCLLGWAGVSLCGQSAPGSLAAIARKRNSDGSQAKARVIITDEHLAKMRPAAPPVRSTGSRAAVRTASCSRSSAGRVSNRRANAGGSQTVASESSKPSSWSTKPAARWEAAHTSGNTGRQSIPPPAEESPFPSDHEFGKYSSPNQVRADHWSRELDRYHKTNPNDIQAKEDAERGYPRMKGSLYTKGGQPRTNVPGSNKVDETR